MRGGLIPPHPLFYGMGHQPDLCLGAVRVACGRGGYHYGRCRKHLYFNCLEMVGAVGAVNSSFYARARGTCVTAHRQTYFNGV